jgi:hypothetical protein
MVCYPIFVERMHAQINVANLVSTWMATSISSHYVPLVVLRDEARFAEIHAQVSELPTVSPIRIATRTALEHETIPEQLHDAQSYLECLPILPLDATS